MKKQRRRYDPLDRDPNVTGKLKLKDLILVGKELHTVLRVEGSKAYTENKIFNVNIFQKEFVHEWGKSVSERNQDNRVLRK